MNTAVAGRAPRFIIHGAGAIGGTIGSRLFQHGSEVVLVARGAHRDAIAANGLRLVAPDESLLQRIPVAGGPAEIDWRPDDVVVLATKSQDTVTALDEIAAAAPAAIAVVCAQNGVANERAALRRFAGVYGVCVQLPTTYLEPGIVVAHSAPLTGGLDVGRYPAGVDERAVAIATTLAAAGFASSARPDIMRWKRAKLLRNVHNSIRALVGPPPAGRELERLVDAESRAVLAAAGIEYVADEEYDRNHRAIVTIRPVEGYAGTLGSTWQSLARGSGVTEADYLNGEIVLEGRLHSVATPVNELLARLSGRLARERAQPGSLGEDEVLALLAPG
jgi:2-dehydropantoate 2-reductase